MFLANNILIQIHLILQFCARLAEMGSRTIYGFVHTEPVNPASDIFIPEQFSHMVDHRKSVLHGFPFIGIDLTNPFTTGGYRPGNSIIKVVPRPVVVSNHIFPSCLSTIRLAIAKPCPVPLPSFFVVKNGSYTRF